MHYYNTIKTLGRGTFSTVHLCERIHNKQKLVIKEIILESTNESDLKAAKNEVAILRSLDHPNIIKYYDHYHKSGVFHIVMEYATKKTLFDFIEKTKPKRFPPQFVMDLFCQILMGLDHIHKKNIIHRDLKCENIFLTGLKGDVVKIGDFGISKSGKKAKTVIGTSNYLAPELCYGFEYTSKTDIWALGCILYEICEMQKLFSGTMTNVVMSITSGRKKQVNTKLYGKQMQEIIDMMLQVEPDNRPTTKELIADRDVFATLYSLPLTLGCIDDL